MDFFRQLYQITATGFLVKFKESWTFFSPYIFFNVLILFFEFSVDNHFCNVKLVYIGRFPFITQKVLNIHTLCINRLVNNYFEIDIDNVHFQAVI